MVGRGEGHKQVNCRAGRTPAADRLSRHDLALGGRDGAHARDVAHGRAGLEPDRARGAARLRVRRDRRDIRRLRVRAPLEPLQPRGIGVRVHGPHARPARGVLQRLGAARHLHRVPRRLDHGDRDLRPGVPAQHRPRRLATLVAARARRLGSDRAAGLARRAHDDALASGCRDRRGRADPRAHGGNLRQARDRRCAARARLYERLPARAIRRRGIDAGLRRERRLPLLRGLRGGGLVRRGVARSQAHDPAVDHRRDRLRERLLRDLHGRADARLRHGCSRCGRVQPLRRAARRPGQELRLLGEWPTCSTSSRC